MRAPAPARTKPQLMPIAVLALPVVVLLAVLAFAWPAARIAPRGLPIGVVGTGAAAEHAALALQQSRPGAFALTWYATDAEARAEIEDRAVYGALEPSAHGLTVLTASAASPTVAQLIDQVGTDFAAHAAQGGTTPAVTTVDVVPSSPHDPHGFVVSSALLPLTICSVIIAAALALLLGVRPAWRQLLALAVTCALAALGVYLIAQGFLGALPGQHIATWASLSLTMFAMSSAIAGFVALLGAPGMVLGALLLVFLGNPFSGATSAPELLPKAVGEIGQLLPPGAGAGLLRDTAYFGGHGSGTHLAVLICWSLFGVLAIVAGHHSFVGHAARRARAEAEAAAAAEPVAARSGLGAGV